MATQDNLLFAVGNSSREEWNTTETYYDAKLGDMTSRNEPAVLGHIPTGKLHCNCSYVRKYIDAIIPG